MPMTIPLMPSNTKKMLIAYLIISSLFVIAHSLMYDFFESSTFTPVTIGFAVIASLAINVGIWWMMWSGYRWMLITLFVLSSLSVIMKILIFFLKGQLSGIVALALIGNVIDFFLLMFLLIDDESTAWFKKCKTMRT